MSDRTDALVTIDATALADVSGGVVRVSSRSNTASTQLTAMMTQITSSIRDLAASRGNQSDPTQLMMMMMMLGGGGFAGGAAQPPPYDPYAGTTAPACNVNVRVGRKGW